MFPLTSPTLTNGYISPIFSKSHNGHISLCFTNSISIPLALHPLPITRMNVSNSTAIHQSPLKSILPRSIAFKAPNQSTLLMASNAVQIVNKASSDKLLKKFAELDEDELSPRRRSSSGSARDALRVMVVKRQRRSFRVIGLDDHSNGESISQSWKSSSSGCNRRALADQKTCLISRCGANGRRSSPAMLRRLGLIRVGEFKNKSLLRAIEKTWRKTLEGASKMFIERHYYYDRHNLLISDV